MLKTQTDHPRAGRHLKKREITDPSLSIYTRLPALISREFPAINGMEKSRAKKCLDAAGLLLNNQACVSV
jgi:hypothetical protein